MGPEFGHFLDSLGWAIVHSFWQGTLAALAVVAFRNLTKDSQAAARYGFQVICMAVCLAAFVITFGIYQMKAYTVSSTSASPFLTLTALMTETRSVLPATADMSVSRLLTLCAPVLGLLWCLGFAGLAARYIGAYCVAQKLRTSGISAVPKGWNGRFRTLVLNAGIRRDVEFFISSRVKGPLTLGFFKPIILVPASFFTQLPCVQAEAILLHEIAHIRRHDYVVNLLQTVIKTVFFFHPAIRYISRKTDQDREHACDDFAVALTRDPQTLARGLAALRLDAAPNRFALAADNGNTPLVARLKRLANMGDVVRRPEHVLTSVATLILAAGLYAAVSPFAGAQPAARAETSPKHPSGKLGNYTFAKVTENNRTFTVKIAGDGTRWINVDGRWYDIAKQPEMVAQLPDMPKPPVPPASKDFQSNADQYKVELDYYKATMTYAGAPVSEPDLAGAKTDIKDTEPTRDRIKREIERDMAQSNREKAGAWERAKQDRDRAEQQAERQRDAAMQQAERQREAAFERAEAEHEAAIERAEIQRQAAIERAEEQMERMQEQLERQEEQRIRSDEQRIRMQEQRERAQEQAERRREKARRDAEKMREKHAQSYQSFSKTLMDQLVTDGLISAGAETVIITYPNMNMTVNGKRVPRNLEGKYCDVLEAYDVQKTDKTRIKIKPSSFEYESTSKDGKSSRHVREDFNHDRDQHTHGYTQGAKALPEPPVPPIVPTQWVGKIKAVPISFTHPTPESRVSHNYTQPGSSAKQHTGIDLVAPIKTPIKASAPGIVTYAKSAGKWGKMIKITHDGGYETHYAHVGEICVAEGETVSSGHNIATVGSTGASTGPHLHFEIHRDGEAQDPKGLIQGF